MPFRGTRQVVGHEHCKVRAVGILHVINLYFGVILRSFLHLGESDAIELVGHQEYAFYHVVEAEVWAHFIFAEVEFLFFHLLGIVIVIPRFYGDAVAMSVGIGLHIGNLLLGLGHGWSPNLVKQFFGVFHCLCHHIVYLIVGKCVETKQVGLASTQFYNFVDDCEVVILVVVHRKMGISLIHLAAQFAVVGVCEYRQSYSPVHCEHPLPSHAIFCGKFGSLCYGISWQPRQFGLVVDDDFDSICFLQHVGAEVEEQVGYFLIYGFQ